MTQNKLKLEDCCLTIEQAKELNMLGIDMKDSLYIYGEDKTGDREPLCSTLRPDIISALLDIEMGITVEISELNGYQIKVDGMKTNWEDLTRAQQIQVLNSFANGYNFLCQYLKEK